MEIVHQRCGHDAGRAAGVETRESGEVKRGEHDLQEMLAVVVARSNARADTLVDIACNDSARAHQRIAFRQPEAFRRQAVGMLEAIVAHSQFGKTGHQLCADLRWMQGFQHHEGRPAERRHLHCLLSAKSRHERSPLAQPYHRAARRVRAIGPVPEPSPRISPSRR